MGIAEEGPGAKLEARELGELISSTSGAFRKGFLTFVGIVLILEVPFAILDWLTGGITFARGLSSSALLKDILLTVLAVVILVIEQGAIIHAVKEQTVGRRVSPFRSLWAAVQRFPDMLGAVLLLLCLLALMVVTLIGIPFAIYFLIAWGFVLQVATVEGVGSAASLGRSAFLVKSNWLRVLGIWFVFGIAAMALSVGISLVVFLGWAGTSGVDMANLAKVTPPVLVSEVQQVALEAVVVPLTVIGATLLYFDLRVRKEGYDFNTMVKELKA